MARVPVQRKVTQIGGRPMPAVPKLSVQIVAHHAYNCACDSCERQLRLERKRVERQRAIAAFGEGRC